MNHDVSLPLLTVCQLGRMGDIVAAEPAYRFLRERYPDRRFRWYTSKAYAELLEFAPFIDEIVTVKDADEYLEHKTKLPDGTVSYEFNFRDPQLPRSAKQRKTANVRKTLLAEFTEAAGLEVPDDTPILYFDPSIALPPLPEQYVVFHCSSRGRSRQWPVSHWHQLADQFFRAGYHVVEIGMEPMLRSNSPLYINHTGMRRLLEVARIIAAARAFVGVESGFGHFANAAGTFGVIITGKLRQYPEYNSYPGRYGRGEGCNLVRFYNQPAYRLPFAPVHEVAARFLSGDPMSYAECDRFCLVEQIKRLQRNPGIHAAEFFLEPFARLKNTLAISRRKKQKA